MLVPLAYARTLCTISFRMATILLVGGFLGATLVRLAPGFGAGEEELDTHLSQESLAALRQSHPVNQGLGRFYMGYWGRVLHGDLGESESLQQPVRQLLTERFPETVKLVVLGLALAWTAGLALALLAVMSRWSFVGLLTTLLVNVLLCVPAAVLAILCLLARAPGRFALALIVLPKVFHYARNLLAQSASLPHVVMARAKGAGSFRVLARHVLPVARPQLLALVGVTVGVAFAAAIPVEVLCDSPGIGQLAWKAAMARDMNLMVILTMIVTLITAGASSVAELLGQPARMGNA